MATYKKHIAQGLMCADCVGLIKSFFWSAGGTSANKYASGCPDTNANGMIKLCNETGAIATMPDIPGLVLWTDGHVGVSIGGGYAIEARGFAYGVVKTRIQDRTWKKWGKLKLLTYVDGDAESDEPETPVTPVAPEQPSTPDAPDANPYAEPTQKLSRGSKGEGVKWLQWMLTKCGYSVGSCGIDGDFGRDTRSAVLKFQQKRMETDGSAGALTRELLKRDAGEDDDDAEDD